MKHRPTRHPVAGTATHTPTPTPTSSSPSSPRSLAHMRHHPRSASPSTLARPSSSSSSSSSSSRLWPDHHNGHDYNKYTAPPPSGPRRNHHHHNHATITRSWSVTAPDDWTIEHIAEDRSPSLRYMLGDGDGVHTLNWAMQDSPHNNNFASKCPRFLFEHATPSGHAVYDDCSAPGAGVVGELCSSVFIPNYYNEDDDDGDDDDTAAAAAAGVNTGGQSVVKTTAKMHKKGGKTAAKDVDLNCSK